MKRVLLIYFTLCHLMSKASILKTAPLYVVWEISSPALMMNIICCPDHGGSMSLTSALLPDHTT
jgi:hypothetical protein